MKINLVLTLLLISSCSILKSQSFNLDPVHTSVTFSVNRFAAVDVKGRFHTVSGFVNYNADSGTMSDANITIDVSSLDSYNEIRDGHLKGEIWLDAEKYPDITFITTSIKSSNNGFVATGDLTIHGVTNEIDLPFQMSGPDIDPTKQNCIGISAELVINRQDYGISFSRLMDNGKMFIGNEVTISIDALMQQVN